MTDQIGTSDDKIIVILLSLKINRKVICTKIVEAALHQCETENGRLEQCSFSHLLQSTVTVLWHEPLFTVGEVSGNLMQLACLIDGAADEEDFLFHASVS